ncbi:hypothetical protein B1P85_16965, partial [Enterococcus faecalis]
QSDFCPMLFFVGLSTVE